MSDFHKVGDHIWFCEWPGMAWRAATVERVLEECDVVDVDPDDQDQ